MKILCLFCLISTVILFAGHEEPKVLEPSGQSAVRNLEVEVTGLGEQRSCKSQPNLYVVYIETNIRIRNLSNRAVILSRVLSPALRARISLSAIEADKGKFVYNPIPDEVTAQIPESPHFGSAPDPASFVVLAPGREYETATWAGVLADLDAQQLPQRPAMTSGNFVMQVFVRTWPYENLGLETFEKIKNRWSATGNLLDEVDSSSNFYPVFFPHSPVSPPCDKFKAPQVVAHP
jgi:hypothetical protein